MIPLQAERKTIRIEPAGKTLLLALNIDTGSLELRSARCFVRLLRKNLAGSFKDRSKRDLSSSVTIEPEGHGSKLTIETLGHARELHLSASDRQSIADVIELLLGSEQEKAPTRLHAGHWA